MTTLIMSSAIAFLRFFAVHAAALLLLLTVVAATGTLLAGRRESAGLRLALGLAASGQILVLLGLAGLLRPWPLAAVAIGLTAGGVARSRFSPAAWMHRPRWRWPALVSIATLPLLLLTLFPPIAFDETLYHLPFVQALAHSGKITFLGHLRFAAFPQLHELLCVPLFLSLGAVATHLVSLVEIIALAALLLDSTRGKRRTAGILAAALCVGHPIVVQLATVNHVEAALMLFVAAGFVCLDRIHQRIPEIHDQIDDPTTDHLDREPPLFARFSREGYAAAAGFLLGTACTVKYLGWYFSAAGLMFLLFFGTARRRIVPVFLCALAVAVLPMYAEIVHFTGNPVHPFLTGIFGASPWAMPTGAVVTPMTRAIGALRLFWDITFARERLNLQPPYSPLFALAFAITLLASARSRRAAFISALGIGYIAIFAFLPQDSRYLVPLIPLVSIAAARVVASWLPAQPRASTIAALLSLLTIAPAAAYAGYRLEKQGWPPVTAAESADYLGQRIPEYRALQRRGPGPAYTCGAEELQSFGDTLLGDVAGPAAAQRILGESRDAAQLARALEQIGVRDLLVSRRRCPPAWQNLPREPFFKLVYEDQGAALWRVRPLTVSRPPTPGSGR